MSHFKKMLTTSGEVTYKYVGPDVDLREAKRKLVKEDVREDCFAYLEEGKSAKCNILRVLICGMQKGECPFYKTVDQYVRDTKRYPYQMPIKAGKGK